jgi:hypothetical protein
MPPFDGAPAGDRVNHHGTNPGEKFLRLVLFVRIGAFQWVGAIPGKKSNSVAAKLA